MTRIWTTIEENERYEIQEDLALEGSGNFSDRFRYRVKSDRYAYERPWWAGKPSTYSEHTVKVDREFNRVWVQNNPELFADAMFRFQEEHPVAQWCHTISLHRNNYIRLIATKRLNSYDPDRDYLREIGHF